MNLFSKYQAPMTVSKAIRLSWGSLAETAILVRISIPVIFAITFAFSFIYYGWPLVIEVLVPYLKSISYIGTIFNPVEHWLGFSLLQIFAAFIFIVIAFMVTYFFLIFLTSLILVPLLNPIVCRLYFPNLIQNEEISTFSSLKNSLVALFIFFAVLIVTFPVLFIPGGQIILPFILNSYLAKRVFPYDVLQNYATLAEFERFRLKENKGLWSIAFLTGGYFYIPVLNLLAAPLTALAFIIFSLGTIQDYRRGN